MPTEEAKGLREGRAYQPQNRPDLQKDVWVARGARAKRESRRGQPPQTTANPARKLADKSGGAQTQAGECAVEAEEEGEQAGTQKVWYGEQGLNWKLEAPTANAAEVNGKAPEVIAALQSWAEAGRHESSSLSHGCLECRGCSGYYQRDHLGQRQSQDVEQAYVRGWESQT